MPVPDHLLAALDVGGTKISGALFSPAAQPDQRPFRVHRVQIPTPGLPGAGDPDLSATAEVARTLAAQADDLGLPIGAVGAGFPEYVHHHQLTSDDVLAWRRQPREQLAESFAPETPVVVDSDVRLGALAEARWGAGAGLASFLYLSWGTGLSSTLVIDGRCWEGAHGRAIAFGELSVSTDVGDGWEGNLESFASGSGIAARYRRSTGVNPVEGARTVLARQAAGDRAAHDMINSAGVAVATALAGVVRVLDPAAVILGGGLGSAGTPLSDLVREHGGDLLSRAAQPRWLSAGLGPQAGLIGAAARAGDVLQQE